MTPTVEDLRSQVERGSMSLKEALQFAATEGARNGIAALGVQLEGLQEWDEELKRDVEVMVVLAFPSADKQQKVCAKQPAINKKTTNKKKDKG